MDAGMIRRGLAMLLLGVAVAAGAAPKSAIHKQSATLYWWGDFDALVALREQVSQPGQWVAGEGTALGEFRGGIKDSMKGFRNVPDAYFVAQDELTLSWARQHPESPLAHVLHAEALVSHAWSYRGTGFANAVPPDAWKEFERYLQRALDYLVAHRDVAFKISDAHRALLNVGLGLGWGPDRLWAVAQDGLKVHPEDIGMYHVVLTRLLPKWGGTAQAVDRFVNLAVEHSSPRWGDEMYARLYSAAAEEQFNHTLFEDSGAEWPRLKASLETLLARLPSPGWRNRYAYMACLARDKPGFLDQMAQLGDAIDRERWGPNPARTIETCRRWAAQQ